MIPTLLCLFIDLNPWYIVLRTKDHLEQNRHDWWTTLKNGAIGNKKRIKAECRLMAGMSACIVRPCIALSICSNPASHTLDLR
jgi:hypothetical protein